MLWFRKDSDRKRRRRRPTPKSTRPDPSRRSGRSGRSSRSDRAGSSSASVTRRSVLEERREQRREDTRDRDIVREAGRRERTLTKEQAEVFNALSFEDADSQPQEIEQKLGQSLNVVIYVLLALLLLTGIAYGIDRGVDAMRARAVAPVQEAALEGRLNVLRDLIATGAPIHGTGPDGATPLMAAVRSGQVEATRMLLEAGAEPTDTTVEIALRYEQWETLRVLMEHGANTEVRGAWHGRSPLELATERRDVEMIALLLRNGAVPDAISHTGPTAQPALHYAAENNMSDVVELLLEHGADPRKTWMGYMPRHLAEDAGHGELAALLAQKEREFAGR